MLLFLHLLPLCLGKLLHVDHLVFLIDYLEAEHGLDDVLQGDDAAQGAVFVDDDGDVLLLLEELLPDGGDVLIFGEGQDGSCQLAQLGVELILGQALQNLLTEHVARDVVALLALIDGDAREVLVFLFAVELAQSHLLPSPRPHLVS